MKRQSVALTCAVAVAMRERATAFICGAGAVIAGVALEGEVATL
ncbi:hypothetical protein [Paraburkholderia bengalensis]